MPVGSVDPEIEEGGSRDWMHEVKLKIEQDAKGVLSSSAPPYYRRLVQIDGENEQSPPSIFRPRRQVAVAAPMPTTPSQQLTDGAASISSGRVSTGGNVVVVAVGPYHDHQSVSRPPLITHAKKCAIVELLARPEFGLDTAAFLEWARDNDALARGCYEPDSFKMRRKELAKMHLLDGCLVLFAVFLLRNKKSSVGEDQVRPYPSCLTPEMSESRRPRGRTRLAQDFINLSADISQHMKETRLDLLLLGNQIPFFLLEHLHLHTKLKGTLFGGIQSSIQDLALSCFDDIHPCSSGFIKQVVDGQPRPLVFPQPVHHLLHLLHWSRVPPARHAVEDDSPPLLGEPESNLPCATWFEESRIGFRTHAAAPGTLHMDFRRSLLGARGVLRVPALHIYAYSKHVFHNLIAFEQSYPMCGLGVTTYCICMAGLLQSEADAKLLRRSGILAHTHETDKDIVALFRGLGEDYRHASYSRDLLDLCKDVDAHHHSTAAGAVKSVVRQCFPRQTVTFFVILAALISFATLVNTIFAVYRFYHPLKK